MDWKALATSFGLVFLAELGDKTQLTTMTLAAQREAPWAVLIGSASALVVSAALGVALGGLISEVVPQEYIRTGAGIAFIIIGVLLVLRKF